METLKWWRYKRLHYNKALLFTGLGGFLVQAVKPAFSTKVISISGELMFEMRSAGIGLTIFLILANIAFTLGWILDLLFNHQNSQSFREWLFLIGYRFSIALLISTIIAFLYLI